MYVFRDVLICKVKYVSKQHWLISLVSVIDTWFINVIYSFLGNSPASEF